MSPQAIFSSARSREGAEFDEDAVTHSQTPKSRWWSVAFVLLFLGLWLLSLDQYLFIPIVAVVSFAIAPKAERRVLLDAPLVIPMLAVGGLAVAFLPFTNYAGDTVRTADIWFSGVLIAIACFRRRWAAGVIVRTFYWVWLLSMAVYALSVVSPGAAQALISAKVGGGPASSRAFWTPSQFFDLEILRPIGFALYANELALFGVLITAIYCWWLSCRTSTTILLVVLSIGGLVLSTSRSLVLTTAIMLVFLLLMQWTARSSYSAGIRLLAAMTALIVAVAAFVAEPNLVPLLTGQFDALAEARYGASADLRELSYETGLAIFAQNPITGVGGLPPLGHIQAGSHSLPISIAVRHGVLGLLALIPFLIVLAWRSVRATSSYGFRRGLVAAFLLTAVVSATAIQFDDDALSFAGVVIAATLLQSEFLDRTGGRQLTHRAYADGHFTRGPGRAGFGQGPR